jgi:integrase
MSVRKRRWKSPNGDAKEAWVVDYRDQSGERHQVTFDRKKDADAHHAAVAVSVRAGTHTPESRSLTVAEAGELWLQDADARELERSTIDAYRIHLKLHIAPLIGKLKVAQLTVPRVAQFEDDLAKKGCSQTMVRYVRRSLGAILQEAQRRGLVAQNVVRSLHSGRSKRGKATERRQRGKPKVGIDIPAPDEIRALIACLTDRRRPLILTAIFTGLRSSELLGLRWADIDLKKGRLQVQQRADRYGKIGPPKSDAGSRDIPLPPFLVNTLREWKLACPKGERDLAFPNIRGGLDHWSSVVMRSFRPAQVRAGIVNAKGRAKYGGLHSLRHFYASWCINRKADGGLELPLKVVQARLGHASIQMTADRYGHLFPNKDDGAELAAAERAFLV